MRLTSCSRSACSMAFRTFFFDVSWASPPSRNSSRMKYAFSKLKMISSSQTWVSENQSGLSAIAFVFVMSIYFLPHDLRCRSICRAARRNGGWSPVWSVHYPGPQWHSRNTDSRIYNINTTFVLVQSLIQTDLNQLLGVVTKVLQSDFWVIIVRC